MAITERTYAPDIHAPLVPRSHAESRAALDHHVSTTIEVANALGVTVHVVRFWARQLSLGIRLTSGFRFRPDEIAKIRAKAVWRAT